MNRSRAAIILSIGVAAACAATVGGLIFADPQAPRRAHEVTLALESPLPLDENYLKTAPVDYAAAVQACLDPDTPVGFDPACVNIEVAKQLGIKHPLQAAGEKPDKGSRTIFPTRTMLAYDARAPARPLTLRSF